MATRHKTHTNRRLVLAGLLAAPLVGMTTSTKRARLLDAVVIGAGVFGSWTAWHLVHQGLSVALVDAYAAGNGLSSSGGETRVTRMAYGPDAIYSRMALEALQQWQALDKRQQPRTGQRLFYPTGVLWLSGQRNAYFDKSLATLAQQAVPHQVFNTRDELQKTWPQFSLNGINTGFLEPASGALAARLGVQAVATEARQHGAHWIQARADQAVPVRHKGAQVLRVPLHNHPDLLAKRVIYACGAWLPKIFPDVLQNRIVPSRQAVFYLDLKTLSPELARRYAPDRFPVWADFNDGDVFYGIPDVAGYGFKIAHDKHGPVMDPDTDTRRASATAEAEMRAYLHKRFPDIAQAPLASVRVCQYENTGNGDFLLDRHPQIDGIWLAGGGSGHGFKHGPAVGQYMADLVTGKRQKTHQRFSLASKRTVQQRQVV